MKLITLAGPRAGRSGAIIGSEVLDFGRSAFLFPIASWIPTPLKEVIAGGHEGMEILRRIVRTVEDGSDIIRNALREAGALTPLFDTRIAAPLPSPTILLSHARAYRDHVAEMKGGEPPPEYPIGFMKNGNSVIGHCEAVRLPPSAPAMVDFEGEISVVFGAPCHGVSAKEAMDYVLGFTIVNDVSARDWVPQIGKFPDRNRMGKQFPGFSPMGPCIATLDEIADPENLHLVTRVNGLVMQDAWTRDLIWSIPELIEYYARWYPFQPGDVLTTGSPAGVGYGRDPKMFLKSGDVVSITVDGIGTLTNAIA